MKQLPPKPCPKTVALGPKAQERIQWVRHVALTTTGAQKIAAGGDFFPKWDEDDLRPIVD